MSKLYFGPFLNKQMKGGKKKNLNPNWILIFIFNDLFERQRDKAKEKRNLQLPGSQQPGPGQATPRGRNSVHVSPVSTGTHPWSHPPASCQVVRGGSSK